MRVTKSTTQTYTIFAVKDLDPITVYVESYSLGQGKIVIECYCDAWAAYWGAMGDNNLQDFFVGASNDYLLRKLLKETHQTDFDEIRKIGEENGFDLCVTSDIEVAMCSHDMEACFGSDWMLDLPRRHTNEYNYLSKIVDAIKAAFVLDKRAERKGE